MTSHMNPLLRYEPVGIAPAGFAFADAALAGPGADADLTPEELAARVAQLGALPQAPLAMPKQKLEHDAGPLRRILRRIAGRPQVGPKIGSPRTEG